MGGLAIECVGLGKKFERVWGIKDVTFRAKKGELTVLVGPNGAGKTTTVRILTTFYKPTKGRAYVLGFDVMKEFREIRRRIAYLPQGYSPPFDVTPKEYILWGLVSRGLSISDARRICREWIETLELDSFKDRTHRKLSGGERRRSAVALVLASGAELIFMDEPTVGLDPEIRQVVWRAIRNAVRRGVSILLTTHDMREAQILADKVVMIEKGKIICEGTPMEIISSLPYSYKVVMEKKMRFLNDSSPYIDLGDRIVVYFKARREAIDLINDLNSDTKIHFVGPVDLEDAYLHMVAGGTNGN